MLFDTLYQGYIVETKRNNTELCKAVSRIQPDEDGRYYILMDTAIDNPDVLRETQRLYRSIQDKSNVSVIRIHSFEFVLLSFTMLEEWIFDKDDNLKETRRSLLEFKTDFVNIICNGADAQKISVIKEAADYSEKLNTEQISAKLLFEITRNTGFETTKGKLGECFFISCCEWKDRDADDICGLDEHRLTTENKIKSIFEHSVLKDSFEKEGL